MAAGILRLWQRSMNRRAVVIVTCMRTFRKPSISKLIYKVARSAFLVPLARMFVTLMKNCSEEAFIATSETPVAVVLQTLERQLFAAQHCRVYSEPSRGTGWQAFSSGRV